MGTVYRADQTEPVKRPVALKLIKTGMDSRAVLARFDAERQALALMDHPNIARVFDGGTTPTGEPFFVMELVKGVPITDHCDRHQLSIRGRLELFVAVCQAVQHAHQKGIVSATSSRATSMQRMWTAGRLRKSSISESQKRRNRIGSTRTSPTRV